MPPRNQPKSLSHLAEKALVVTIVKNLTPSAVSPENVNHFQDYLTREIPRSIIDKLMNFVLFHSNPAFSNFVSSWFFVLKLFLSPETRELRLLTEQTRDLYCFNIILLNLTLINACCENIVTLDLSHFFYPWWKYFSKLLNLLIKMRNLRILYINHSIESTYIEMVEVILNHCPELEELHVSACFDPQQEVRERQIENLPRHEKLRTLVIRELFREDEKLELINIIFIKFPNLSMLHFEFGNKIFIFKNRSLVLLNNFSMNIDSLSQLVFFDCKLESITTCSHPRYVFEYYGVLYYPSHSSSPVYKKIENFINYHASYLKKLKLTYGQFNLSLILANCPNLEDIQIQADLSYDAHVPIHCPQMRIFQLSSDCTPLLKYAILSMPSLEYFSILGWKSVKDEILMDIFIKNTNWKNSLKYFEIFPSYKLGVETFWQMFNELPLLQHIHGLHFWTFPSMFLDQLQKTIKKENYNCCLVSHCKVYHNIFSE